MNEQSIEFDKIKEDSTLPGIVRKSFRIPIEDTRKVKVIINNNPYTVLDIAQGGIRIVLAGKSLFSINQALKNCELVLLDISIKKLNGKIIHMSSGSGKEWEYGIQWIDMEKTTEKQIAEIISKMKSQLLTDDGN